MTVGNKEEKVMFEPMEDSRMYVQDSSTGVAMFVKSTSDIGTLAVFVQFPDGRKVEFDILRELKFPDRPYVSGDRSNPMIKLLLASFNTAVKANPGTYEENSKFVRYLLTGLSVINRRWPLSRSPFFYSDLDFYKGREDIFPFSFPSDEEIAEL
jgi:hypothetical protein